MERGQLLQNKSMKGVIMNELPFIERKQSNSFEQQQRYFYKNKINSQQQTIETYQSKLIKNQVQFLLPKNHQKKVKQVRIALTPNKIELREKLYQTLQENTIKRQLDSSNNNNQSIFNSDFKNSGQKELGFKAANDRPSNRAYIYQPFKKSSTHKDRLKPILRQNKLGNQSQFLNVEKMVLIQDRSRKSHSVAVDVEKVQKEGITAQLISHKLVKESKKGRQLVQIEPLPELNESAFEKQVDNQEVQTNQNIKFESQTNSNLLEGIAKVQTISRKRRNSPQKRNRRQINKPFQTYYYRDLLWKVNYTNQLYIQIPLEYEHRLKVFVGKGNNSCMVSGLISRRPWYAFTDRLEEANFVWTQLKMLAYYSKQQPFTQEIARQEKNTYQLQSILTGKDSKQFNNYMANYFSTEERCDERLISRSKAFKYRKYVKSAEIRQLKVHNHLINNYVIGNKKALFNTMINYYQEISQEVFKYLPLTFHIQDGMQDKRYFQFLKYYHKRAKQVNRNNEVKTNEKQYNAWIVKPGQNSNRGNGIKMCLSLEDIKSVLKKRQMYNDGTFRTYIVQAYIQRPLLYFKRKFDLRHYMMITCINGLIKGYWYRYGYVRTTSSEYSLTANDGAIHLTNDAVQKNLPDYGKYEKGNKISYDDLNAYIQKYHKKKKINFYQHIYPKMKKMATDAIKACSGGIDPNKLQSNFQVFGMDFMIDANLDVWLIQINTNPCLQLSCPLLASLIPKMVENALELTLDAIFPPPVRYTPKGVHYFKQLEKQNKFELVYDERIDKIYKGSLQVLDNKLLEEEDDTFQDCGDEWEDN